MCSPRGFQWQTTGNPSCNNMQIMMQIQCWWFWHLQKIILALHSSHHPSSKTLFTFMRNIYLIITTIILAFIDGKGCFLYHE